MADSKTKLAGLVQRKWVLSVCVRDSTRELQTIVKKYEGGLREAQERPHPSEMREIEGSGDWNVSREIRSYEDALWMLLDIEERLRKVQHTEDSHHLWEVFVTEMREWWLEIGYVEEEKEDTKLRMMWNSKDGVWLLGCKGWDNNPVWTLPRVRDTLEQIYPTDINTIQYLYTPEGREQLLATFQQRLKLWQDRAESLGQQYRDLDYMLQYWQEHCEVRQTVLRTIMFYEISYI